MRNTIRTAKNLKDIIAEKNKDPRIAEAETLEARAKELRKEALNQNCSLILDSLLDALNEVQNQIDANYTGPHSTQHLDTAKNQIRIAAINVAEHYYFPIAREYSGAFNRATA